jgi:SPP1 gp7 family putative phage head morphogenesis protein
MATNNNYWKERALEVENNSRSTAEIGRKEIEKIFAVTYSRLKKEINYWWHRFAVNNSLTLSEAKKLMKSKELEELDWDVEEYIKKGIEAAIVTLPEVDKQLENASAKVHINRLTALKLQVLVIANEMFSDVNKTVKDCMRKVYEDAYYTTAYNIQNGIGVYSDFNRINDRVLEQVLQRPWAEDGSNFSERIWGKQRPKLVNKIHKDLVDCVSRGRNPNEYTEELAKEFKVGLNQANNLIVTEYNYFNERATQDCMKELDVEEYEILGTLDGATCATCGGLDGKHYLLKDAVIGINSPPFHPRCRCTTIPYFNDEFTQGEERAYKGEDGKTHYTKAKTYDEWKKEFVNNNKFTSANNDDIIKSGGISGALNPSSERAQEHAEKYYQAVRKMKTDCKRIARNTGYSEDEIKQIKKFIFIDKHELGDGKFEQFAPSYEMAESWQRLIDGKNIQSHDLTLLKHEIMEKGLMKNGYSQDEAHTITSQKYNYAKEAYEYYDKIKANREK